MAKTLSITAPDAEVDATIDALCQRGGYQSGDKVAFAQGVLLDWLGRVRSQAAMAGVREQQNQVLSAAQKAVSEANAKAREAVTVAVK